MAEVLFDTSILIDPPAHLDWEHAAVSVVSLGELEWGFLVARTTAERVDRLDQLDRVRKLFRPLPFDESAAHEYAVLASTFREAGRNPRVIDTQIAATARANGLTLVTRDREQAQLLDRTILVA